MDYSQKLKYHFKTKKGWVNDPNGLVCYKGYYHVFYQHSPNFEVNGREPIYWGHARTKNFLDWEELPIALAPDKEYDKDGCWSGTAIVKDETLYLFYASIERVGDKCNQRVSVAYSKDGINFTKYDRNPVIDHYPSDGGPDFRDPAVCRVGDDFYCVMATGNPETKTGRLLLYKSQNLLDWQYEGIMAEWQDCRYTECPSFMRAKDKYLLTASVCPLSRTHFFAVMYGEFKDGKFTAQYVGEVDKGPDQYAGQAFLDDKGRNLLIAWLPGWAYKGYYDKDVGCMSVPRELKLIDGKIYACPVDEIKHLLKDEDECVERTEKGFIVKRTNRESLVVECDIKELKILRDGYIVEIFVNGGESVYSVLL